MIEFGVWAPDQATFWTSWQGAGICDADRNLLPPYAGCVEVTDGWSGIVTRPTGETDEHGAPITEDVPGWHCNVRVSGAVAEQFTAGLQQFNADGTWRSIWDRTRAAQAFQLSPQEADEETGFPAGMRSPTGVVYADAADFSSPACVWQ